MKRRREKDETSRLALLLINRLPRVLLDRYPRNDPDHPSTWPLRFVRLLPTALVASPERVVLNSSFVLIGAGSFLAAGEGSVPGSWPEWVLVAWSLAMIVGGLSVLVGMFRSNTTVERLGYLLVGPACLLYGTTVLFVRGWPGLASALIFLGLAAAKAIRMIISSAERDITIEYGEKLDRDQARGDES
jgi:hypothetical protein